LRLCPVLPDQRTLIHQVTFPLRSDPPRPFLSSPCTDRSPTSYVSSRTLVPSETPLIFGYNFLIFCWPLSPGYFFLVPLRNPPPPPCFPLEWGNTRRHLPGDLPGVTFFSSMKNRNFPNFLDVLVRRAQDVPCNPQRFPLLSGPPAWGPAAVPTFRDPCCFFWLCIRPFTCLE